MKALYYGRNGGPEVFTYGDVPDPRLLDDMVLIRVDAISIEGGDVLNRHVTPPPSTQHVCGYQAAGIVEAVGSTVDRVAVGQRVVGFHWAGSHAELFAVQQHHVYPIPDSLDTTIAAAVPIAFGTASDALFEFGKLERGETILIQGAAGGVGIAAVQLAHQAGARVITTASSPQRLERLREYGADAGIDYRDEDIAARALELTDGRGVDFVLDLAGGKSLDALMGAVRYRGRFATVGASSRDLPAFQFMDLVQKSLTVFGTLFGAEMAGERAHDLIAELFIRIGAGELRMPIEQVFPLSNGAIAHRFVEQGHPFGRVMMTAR